MFFAFAPSSAGAQKAWLYQPPSIGYPTSSSHLSLHPPSTHGSTSSCSDLLAITKSNSNIGLREQEGSAEITHREEESDEDEIVGVDVNSVDEERKLDSDVHQALLEASSDSEVTLPVAVDEVDAELRAETEAGKLEDVD